MPFYIAWNSICVRIVMLFRVMVMNELVLEEVLNGLVRNHLLVKDISTSLGALYHLDYLGV